MKYKLIPKAKKGGSQFQRFQWDDKAKQEYAKSLGIDPSLFEYEETNVPEYDPTNPKQSYQDLLQYVTDLNKSIWGDPYEFIYSNPLNKRKNITNNNTQLYDDGEYYGRRWNSDVIRKPKFGRNF